MRYWLELVLALPFGLLPKRHWDAVDLPVLNVAFASALVTFFAGTTLGILGYFAFMAEVLAAREWTAPPFMIYVFVSYVFATPQGLFSLYLTASGFIRIVSWYTGEALGDPILTIVDALARQMFTQQRDRSERVARQKLEGAEEPDRRYDGEWAGLPNVTYVIVSARRKPGWTKGTWVTTTDDGWYTLGEPFDRPFPQGIRTVYPLTLQGATLEVLRKAVSYELPPLRRARAKPEASSDSARV